MMSDVPPLTDSAVVTQDVDGLDWIMLAER
jgi:hypothetical protein